MKEKSPSNKLSTFHSKTIAEVFNGEFKLFVSRWEQSQTRADSGQNFTTVPEGGNDFLPMWDMCHTHLTADKYLGFRRCNWTRLIYLWQRLDALSSHLDNGLRWAGGRGAHIFHDQSCRGQIRIFPSRLTRLHATIEDWTPECELPENPLVRSGDMVNMSSVMWMHSSWSRTISWSSS